MLLTFDLNDYHGNTLFNVATGEDGERYFLEGGVWKTDGKRSEQWRGLLRLFRRSDWGGFHISGCPSNQYMAAQCLDECDTMSEMLYDLYGGFPEGFNPGRDEKNQYRSSVETYG